MSDETQFSQIRGDELAEGAAPAGVPDSDDAVEGTIRGGSGLADDAGASAGATPDPDELAEGSIRGEGGLADDAG